MKPKEAIKPEKPKARVKYQIYKSTSGTSSVYWIFPLVTIVLVVLAYLATNYYTSIQEKTGESSKASSLKIQSNLDDLDMLNNRSRAGEPINLNETNWGREDPLSSY